MTKLELYEENKTLTLFPEGRVDSANAGEFEEKVNEAIDSFPGHSIVMDCRRLDYVSSAGLRVLLRIEKRVPSLSLREVSPQLYSIFEMTGFTEIMPIEKALRVLSVEGCEVLGRGAHGAVCRYDPETVVKVFYDADGLNEIKRERELARATFILGIPTAISYDVVRIEGGGYGSVYELLNAKSFAELLASGEMTVDRAAELSVSLLKQIHSKTISPDIAPNKKEYFLFLAGKLEGCLPEDGFNKLISLIEALPETDSMLHGDYHIKNLLLQNGEPLLIDMDTISRGHPIFELAGMYSAYCGFAQLDHTVSKRFFGIEYDEGVRLWERSLALYLETEDEERIRAAADKAKLLSFVRVGEHSLRKEGPDAELLRRCLDSMEELLERVDTLEL